MFANRREMLKILCGISGESMFVGLASLIPSSAICFSGCEKPSIIAPTETGDDEGGGMIVSTQVTTLDAKRNWFVVTLLFDWTQASNPDTLIGNLVGADSAGGHTDLYVQDVFDIRSVLRTPGDIPPIRSVMGTIHFDDFSTNGIDTVLGNGPVILQAPDTGITLAIGPTSNVMKDMTVPPPTMAGSAITYVSFSLPFLTLGPKITISKICDLYGNNAPFTHNPAGFGTISLCTFDVPTFFK